jgi:hypothetical protein
LSKQDPARFAFRADMAPQISKRSHNGRKHTLAPVIKPDLPDRPDGRRGSANRRDDTARIVVNVEPANPIVRLQKR